MTRSVHNKANLLHLVSLTCTTDLSPPYSDPVSSRYGESSIGCYELAGEASGKLFRDGPFYDCLNQLEFCDRVDLLVEFR